MVSDRIVGRRVARVRNSDGRVRDAIVDEDSLAILGTDDVLALLDGGEPGPVTERVAIEDSESLRPHGPWQLLAPLIAPETWAAGVTYERSRDARVRESHVADVYDLVYEAKRPELFFKDAAGRRTVAPGEPISIRTDAAWSVPEPELAVVLGGAGQPLAVTIGNDVSARDIEGANPLYLPQAKIYAGACALGPALLVPADWTVPFEIELRILGPGGETLFAGQTSTDRMRRTLNELVEFLVRDNPLPAGSVLLTGTGVVPPDDFTLAPGQTVEIAIAGIGTLRNPVALAGQQRANAAL
jgi:2-dehydro-3-deoxy-D-arabinonate dehydratase